MKNLLSDQVNINEIEIILRELSKVIDSGIEGDVVEFGCYVGTTTVFLSNRLSTTGNKLYVYDSFDGLPEKTREDASPIGAQFSAGQLKATKKQLIKNLQHAHVPMPIIKKAWFSDLKPDDIPDKIAFAFLDGDYYASVKQSLRLIESKLVPGSVIIIDDYSNQSLPGVSKAVDEWLKHNESSVRVEHSLAVIKPAIKR